MIIERDIEQQIIYILNNKNIIVAKLHFIPSFFLWEIYTKEPIIITSKTDEIFFNNLNRLMTNSYNFANKYSKKSQNELIWFSEQCFNIEDEKQCETVSRLIIRKNNDEIYISYSNPFFEKNNINRNGIISFSPNGNGFWSKNPATGSSLQDDIINVFYSTLGKKNKKLNKSL